MDWLDVPNCLRELYPQCRDAFANAIEHDLDEFESPVFGTMYKSGAAFKPLGDIWQGLQTPFGGPNPLTAMLLTGAIGAGMGYGGSKLLSGITPNKYIDDQRRTKNWTTLGALGGLALPAYLYARPAVQLHGWQGLLRRGDEPPPALPPQQAADPTISKIAADAGAAFAPIVPVDAFNNVILTDQYLTPEMKALTAGLTTAAALSRGGADHVSPADIGRVAIGMGAGWMSGMLVGKTLGALAGVRPEVQQTLARTGALAGLVKQVVPLIFQ